MLRILIGVRDGGDWIGCQDGRRLGTSRWVWTRRARVVSMCAWARNGLTRRPTAFLMSDKFVLVAHGECGGDDDGRGVDTWRLLVTFPPRPTPIPCTRGQAYWCWCCLSPCQFNNPAAVGVVGFRD